MSTTKSSLVFLPKQPRDLTLYDCFHLGNAADVLQVERFHTAAHGVVVEAEHVFFGHSTMTRLDPGQTVYILEDAS